MLCFDSEEHQRRTRDAPCPFFNCKLAAADADGTDAAEEPEADTHQEEETQADGQASDAGSSRTRGRKGKSEATSIASASAARKASTRRTKALADENAKDVGEEEAEVVAGTVKSKKAAR